MNALTFLRGPLAHPTLQRLRWQWHRRLGGAGALGLLALVAAALLPTVVRPTLQRDQAALLRAHVAQLDSRARLIERQDDLAAARDPRDLARDALPSDAARMDSLVTLLRRVEAARLAVKRGEYAAETQAPGLVRVRVSLPVQAGYAEVRRLVASLLNDLPHAALDGLDLERSADGQTLGGVVRLSLFFRQETP